MKKIIIVFVALVHMSLSYGQTTELDKLNEWITANNIVLDKPITPVGFERYTDCQNRPVYKKQIADTIILYTSGGSIAENLDTLKKTIKEDGYNTFRYPSYIQDNATIVVTKMSKNIFVWKKDTLYLKDTANLEASEAQIQLMRDYFSKKISKAVYKQKLKDFDESKFPFIPQFKVIYFKGIFDDGKIYQFSSEQNFRNEKVHLIAQWKENGKNYYEIDLETHTNGRFRFSEDMKVLERTNCKYYYSKPSVR